VKRNALSNAGIFFFLSLFAAAFSGDARAQEMSTQPQSEQGTGVGIPARPDAPLFKGEQGDQTSETNYSAATGKVTLKVHVEDTNGYFLPNLRPEDFAVYEDGVRQKNVSVEIEHAPVSVALLMEFGGRYHELNKALAMEVTQIGRQLLDVVQRGDAVGIFTYDGKFDALSNFSQPGDSLAGIFDRLSVPEFSELSFYDALIGALNHTREQSGRRAVIVVSTGLDTSSKATYQQALQTAQGSVPIYAIALTHFAQSESAIYGSTAPFARIDWNRAAQQLEELARASGGRMYEPDNDIQVPAIYDDIMENLRVRYVVSYVPSNAPASGRPRAIRVALIDPKTGGPLVIHDSNGKPIVAKVFVQRTYTPSTTSGH
jgi:VWFA-related protein